MSFIAQQSYKIDLTPQGGYVVVYVSQHDNEAREIVFKIYNQGQVFDIPANINVSVQGVKSNSGYFTHNCTYSGNLVTMPITDDMTDVIGKAVCVLKFTNASEEKLATAKFILNVDSDSSSEGIIIDTVAEEIFDQLMDEIRAQAAGININIATLQSMVGTPLIAATAAGMTDHNKIYVYTGDETGYTNGNWYYWDGSAWTSGGVYNSTALETDTTLTLSGRAADAEAVGGRIAELASDLLSSNARAALLACFEHVAWIDEDGHDYYDALESALFPNAYPKITVTFDAGANVIYTDDALSTLKQYLTVKYYADSSSSGVTVSGDDYTLTGTLTEGANTLVVAYGNLTALVTIRGVVDFYNIYNWELGENLDKIQGGFNLDTSTGELTISLNAAQIVGRRSFVTDKGKAYSEYVSYQDRTQKLGSYPIPIPKDANKVTISINPNTQYINMTLTKYIDGSYSQVTAQSWTQGSFSKEFTAAENQFISINSKYDSSGTSYPTEPMVLTVEFSTV